VNNVVVTDAARTPFGNFGGVHKDFTVPELGAIALQECSSRAA